MQQLKLPINWYNSVRCFGANILSCLLDEFLFYLQNILRYNNLTLRHTETVFQIIHSFG